MSDALLRIFRGLPRYAPGSDDATREALRRLGPLPPRPRVIDLGCGGGAQTLTLAAALDGPPIVAVDRHRPFLDELDAAASRAGLGHRIRTRCADFAALDDAPGSYDLVWSEGAIYHLGLADGQRRWRPLLAPGGRLAATELTWTTDDPPAEAAAFWGAAHPAMADEADDRRVIAEAGWIVLDAFALPASAWWDGYYAPLDARLAELMPEADASLRAAVAETRREIDLWRRHGSSYGYVFYLLRPR
ncbi:MAG: class I SAM-dependent methyltransferase [bacterium]|nr:class I SAM-dependent methyltransferase [bacterium]